MDYDVLVVGGGAAGMESALTLGDMGFSVLLVEREPSIGGVMILLSKVFPTLDCASCIATPKMAATFHHPNVTTMAYTEVKNIAKQSNGVFKVILNKKSPYVNLNQCTGCQQCEQACTVALPDQFNHDLVGRRAVYIPYAQAIPKKALVERYGSSPCTFACPAGIKAHGYVSLIRSGLFDKALELILEEVPFPGTLGKTCPAPCEKACTRGELEGAIPIRKLKRFAADHYYARYPQPEFGAVDKNYEEKVAIVGSGPAGLTAAYHLAKLGYPVTVFEAEDEPGGMLRVIPGFKLPGEVLDRDIMNITALGVEIRTDERLEDPAALKEKGFQAILLAYGANEDAVPEIPGKDLNGVTGAIKFLKKARTGEAPNLKNKKVLVLGGHRYNMALNCARTARRLGAQRAIILYPRDRDEIFAIEPELEDAREEGVEFRFRKTATSFNGNDGKLTQVELAEIETGKLDRNGRVRTHRPRQTIETIEVDQVIMAIGRKSNPKFRGEIASLEITRLNTREVDPKTLATNIPGVFAAGDAVSGPATVVEAINAGNRVSRSIHRFLRGKDMHEEKRHTSLPAVDNQDVLKRQEHYQPRRPIEISKRPAGERTGDFSETELPFDAQSARLSAARCLDCGGCSECHQCVSACPADAMNLDLRDEENALEIGSVIIATGFRLHDPAKKALCGYKDSPNVITAMQMERILSPTRPYNAVVRPSDGKVPDNIAYILCTGSRDCQVGNPLCSRVCCMYSAKQAQLLMGAVPLADITIYYIDIRAFGKGFEEFYQQAKAMGVYFVKGKVGRVDSGENGNLVLHYEDIANTGKMIKAEHDLVVLSVGLESNAEALDLFKAGQLDADDYGYVKDIDEDMNPGRTSIDGVFAAGSASAVMDIPDTILHAGASVAQAAAYVKRIRT
jgi:heterodisulfide reductase subunit A